MGRRRTKSPEVGETLLTEGLVLKSLSLYGRPMRLESIVRQMLHTEKRLGQDSKIYLRAVEDILTVLVGAGRVRVEAVDVGSHNSITCYSLGPLERLSLV
jgi:hypothetical protein